MHIKNYSFINFTILRNNKVQEKQHINRARKSIILSASLAQQLSNSFIIYYLLLCLTNISKNYTIQAFSFPTSFLTCILTSLYFSIDADTTCWFGVKPPYSDSLKLSANSSKFIPLASSTLSA
ncbi:MAG: hypothetical protein BWY74_01355 [Firmicutes bacterium ADurb.Bin419]|nr:MAG: hypothetical protein BWY74_01355 [Firmicutes bacterium ADurb.Bin419]